MLCNTWYPPKRVSRACLYVVYTYYLIEQQVDQRILSFEYALSRWIPDCANKFVELRQHWAHLLPETRTSPLKQTRVFFSSIEALMSNQLRSIVEASIHELTEFIEEYKVCYIRASNWEIFWQCYLIDVATNRLRMPSRMTTRRCNLWSCQFCWSNWRYQIPKWSILPVWERYESTCLSVSKQSPTRQRIYLGWVLYKFSI